MALLRFWSMIAHYESSYAVFEQAFGPETLSREAHPITSVSVEQLEQLRTCIDALGLTPAHVTKRKVRPSVPRAAFSHSASVGRRSPAHSQ